MVEAEVEDLSRDCYCREVKDLRDVLLTNVVGTYMVTKALLPSIRKGHKKQVGSCSAC